MAGETLKPRARQKVYDLLHRYLWCMDTGDLDGVIACFTKDGVVKDVAGKRWGADEGGAAGFASHYLHLPNRAGGQHWLQPLQVEKVDRGYRITSYWHSIKWETNPDRRFIRSIGVYRDTVVKTKGKWLIKEKVIDPWNGESATMMLDVREAIWTPQNNALREDSGLATTLEVVSPPENNHSGATG